jgi:hypothetical protein
MATPMPPPRSCQPYARWPAFAYRALLSLVGNCGHLSNDRITLVGWGVLRFTSRKVQQTFLSQPRNLSFFVPAVGSGSFLRTRPCQRKRAGTWQDAT